MRDRPIKLFPPNADSDNSKLIQYPRSLPNSNLINSSLYYMNVAESTDTYFMIMLAKKMFSVLSVLSCWAKMMPVVNIIYIIAIRFKT